MREGLFIKKNKGRWQKLQEKSSSTPDETARDFIQLVDDLGYAKTFYPASRVTQYINALASRLYLNIYQNRKEEKSRLLAFWTATLPLTVFRHRKIILFAFFLFILFYVLGFFSALKDPVFVRQVLGDNYVNMTERNIDDGNPFGIYQSGTPFFNWIGIMINNIIVSFMYFLKGLLAGIFSITSMIKESMRIGAFHYMFFSKGYGLAFIMAVMIHGILELPAIVFASAAGVVLGTSYLFPGTGTRLNALRRGVKDGVVIVIGMMPVLIVAGFYEGFVTRHYKMPFALNLLILASSAFFMIWYFVIYPARVQKKQNQHGG